MKSKKILVSLVAGTFLLAAAPILPAVDSLTSGSLIATADAAKGGARFSAPRPSTPRPSTPSTNSNKPATSNSGSTSVSGNGKDYKPSKDSKDLNQNAPAAGRTNTANPAAAGTQSSSRLGSFMRGVGFLAGGMFLGSMLASLFGMGGGFLADILGLLMNVVLFAAIFMGLRILWNKFRGGSSQSSYNSAGNWQARRDEPIDITPRHQPPQFRDIKPQSFSNDYDAKSTADRYRNR